MCVCLVCAVYLGLQFSNSLPKQVRALLQPQQSWSTWKEFSWGFYQQTFQFALLTRRRQCDGSSAPVLLCLLKHCSEVVKRDMGDGFVRQAPPVPFQIHGLRQLWQCLNRDLHLLIHIRTIFLFSKARDCYFNKQRQNKAKKKKRQVFLLWKSVIYQP